MTNRAERPNVIVVFTDQQRWDTTGVHGNPLDLTPNFDSMARTGTHAVQAFTPQPVCGPARAALQTGQYQTTTGCYRNDVALPRDSRTLAHYFGEAGYATGYIGKWHLARQNPVPAEARAGYDYWLGANTLEFTSDAYRTIMFDGDDKAVRLPGYRSDACFDAAIRYVTNHHDEPFYLFLSVIEPHHQNEVDSYPAPIGYEQRYQGRWMPPDLATLAAEGGTSHRHIGGYLGQVRRVDEGLGRLFDALRSLDLYDNTIVAFTSDHGCHFKTRNAEYKRSCHDGSIRVPLAVRGPGFDGGGAIDRPISVIDLPPTLLDAAGVGVPEAMQGNSFAPLIRDPKAEFPDEVFVQVSESECGRVIRTSRWKYYVVAPGADGWNTPASEHYVETALYDLAHDPYELDNLIRFPSHRPIADELRERLLRRMREVGEPEPTIEPPALLPKHPQRSIDPRAHRLKAAPIKFN